MTIANRITIFRLGIVPFFCTAIVLHRQGMDNARVVAVILLALAGISDFLDGWVARRFNQRSELGALLDPLADKLLINLAYVLLAVDHHLLYGVPRWFPPVVLARDLMMGVGSALLNAYWGPFRITPRLGGKVATTVQFITLFAVLMQWRAVPWLLWAALGTTVLSGGEYALQEIRHLWRYERKDE